MFWYLIQISVMIYVIVLYRSEIAPNAFPLHIAMFALLVSYAVTWILSKVIDLVKKMIFFFYLRTRKLLLHLRGSEEGTSYISGVTKATSSRKPRLIP